MQMDRKFLTIALAGVLSSPAGAALAEDSSVYNLGEIHVTATAAPAPNAPDSGTASDIPFQPTTPPPLGGDTITAKKIEAFDAPTLDKAAQLTPGVIAEDMAGPRNEQNIYVHGFDRWQVPLLLDGVRIYLPYDNRLDFGRFLEGNLAEVQISKGYASVLDGPGGLGGEINLVTRKPTKAVEGEIGTTFDFGGKGWYEGERTYARVGTKQDLYYLQASGAWNVSRGWELPGDFTPTANQGAGLRDNSQTRDWNANLKAGYTPNGTDEYSINFLHQEGEKGAPYDVNLPIANQKYWVWPFWNAQTLSLLTHTVIDSTSYFNSKIYWNRMDNDINAYSNAAQTLQDNPKAFDSTYHDWSLGVSLEGGKDLTNWDTLKAAFHYRRDTHNENEGYFTNDMNTLVGCTANVVCYSEPRVTSMEDTFSAALENTIHVGGTVDLVQGFSYDWRHLIQAQGFNSSVTPFAIVNYPTKDGVAPNIQGAAIWRYNDTDKVYFDVSDRTRFPTLFERFSTRFGGAISNPSLAPERATNLQLGWEGLVLPKLKVSADAYYSVVQDMIESVGIVYSGTAVTQSQNVGLGHVVGSDLKADYALRDDLAVGGHLSLIHRYVDTSVAIKPNIQLIGAPDASGMLYVTWRPLPNLTLTPNVQFASSRWTEKDTNTAYYQTGAYALYNFKAEYKVQDNLTVYAGAKNIFDRLYVLTDGFPEPGRSFYVGAKATF